jgi:hypothetical protein
MAEALRRTSGELLPFSVTGPSEGKCSLVAEMDGLLLFDEESVHEINSDEN